jgi:hypothetical protein
MLAIGSSQDYQVLFLLEILMNIFTMLKISLQVCSTTEYQPQKL